MVRTRRTAGQLIDEVRSVLLEPDPNQSFWSTPLLINILNQQRDQLEMLLKEADDGYGVKTETADLVASQAKYQQPTHTSRIRRVLLVGEGGEQTPLPRESQHFTTTGWSTGTPSSYRLRGEYIVLDPAPTQSKTGGLLIEIETAADRVSETSQAVPADWPIETETLLVYSVAKVALDIENSQGPPQEGLISTINSVRSEYFAVFVEFVQDRSNSPQYLVPFSLGD